MNFDHSAYVGYTFCRPFPEKIELEKKITDCLLAHKEIIDLDKEYIISENFKLRIMPSSKKRNQQFNLAFCNDLDSMGFLAAEVYRNLDLVIKDKEKKIKPYRENYSQWWLALVDKISYGLIDLRAEKFYEQKKLNFQFDRILLVSASDFKNFSYLYE